MGLPGDAVDGGEAFEVHWRPLTEFDGIGQYPAFDHTHADGIRVLLELDELHGVLQDLRRRCKIIIICTHLHPLSILNIPV